MTVLNVFIAPLPTLFNSLLIGLLTLLPLVILVCYKSFLVIPMVTCPAGSIPGLFLVKSRFLFIIRCHLSEMYLLCLLYNSFPYRYHGNRSTTKYRWVHLRKWHIYVHIWGHEDHGFFWRFGRLLDYLVFSDWLFLLSWRLSSQRRCI